MENGKYLINTDNWFIAPDGNQYRAVYGDCEIFNDDELGIKTNDRSSNWFVKVSGPSAFVIIAGCQIHYAVKTDHINKGLADSWSETDDGVKYYKSPSRIYFP